MVTRKQIISQYVVCIDKTGYAASLELHKIYRTLPDKDALVDGNIRVLDESSEDYLYSQDQFVPIRVPAAVKSSFVHVS